jgi:sugar lactone lactonase YvrE
VAARRAKTTRPVAACGRICREAAASAASDVARDQRGTTWIADTYNNALRNGDRRGVISTFVGPEAGLNLPFDLALDPRGRLYVADTYNHRIVRFDAPGATPVVLLDGLRFPFGVDVTPDGRVLVADTFANRVWPWSATGH